MSIKSSPSLYEQARELRKKSTKAEKLLWEQLRGRRLEGKKFRR
jgi:very-short-patch-repair endonuclease